MDEGRASMYDIYGNTFWGTVVQVNAYPKFISDRYI